MSVQKLKDLIALGSRNVSRKVQRALEEVGNELAGRTQVQPRAIPIPVVDAGKRFMGRSGREISHRSQFIRYYGSFSGFNGTFNFNNHCKSHRTRFHHFRFFKFYHKCPVRQPPSKIFGSLKKGFLFSNFSQKYQSSYRVKMFNQNVKITYRSFFNFPFSNNSSNIESNRLKLRTQKGPKQSIRLNLSLSPQFHRITLSMAKNDPPATFEEKLQYEQLETGCYIEFPIKLDVSIPSETMLSENILDELLLDLNSLLKRIEELKQDLTNLFELGELPLEYISSKNVIRVHFPNCDKEKLESLCREKNIQGGYIYEDQSSSERPSAPGSYASFNSAVDRDDILSSYFDTNETVSSMTASTDDILSSSLAHPLSNNEVVRIVTPEISQAVNSNAEVMFNDYDESYWVTSV
ncbi:uncharacterized protein PRCAT00004702001 [Priceomyces carsonii]|uniref:uncharacterized protein n=1 Tax=Priceomyces carsonii TaxID=28549 RepID=UPI002EDA8B0E|nr:unnamed protein product [Priceomyces carsonii]